MDTPHPIRSEAEYEAEAVAALVRLGMTEPEAQAYVDGRFPLSGSEEVLAELRGRKVVIDRDDLTAFLRERFETDRCPDGAPLDGDAVGWPRYIVNDLATWAVNSGRASAGKQPPRPVWTLEEMLAGLRSSEPVARMISGQILATSLGAGCRLAGENPVDFEHILSPALSDLIGRAMAGDGSAVDELERIVTNDFAKAFNPNPSATQAGQGVNHG